MGMRATRRSRAVVCQLVIGCVLAAGLGACDSTVTEADLEKWSHNDLGMDRIGEVVADQEQPVATRVRALEVVVQIRQPLRVRGMIDSIGETETRTAQQAADERSAITDSLVTQLLKHVQERSEDQWAAKDTLMTLIERMSPERLDEVRKAVARWAFSDVTWESSADDVKEKVQRRMSSGQIADLAAYGVEAAGILISHGFVVDKMVRYLGELNTPESIAVMLRGLRRVHENIGVQTYHLAGLHKTKHPAAAAYLFELYRNPNLTEQTRTDAFNAALDMLKAESIKASPKRVIAQLLALVGGANAEDRWLGANNLIALTGTAHLEELLAGFKDDKVYAGAGISAQRGVQDLCLEIADKAHIAKAGPVLRRQLAADNRIAKAIAIVCLKAGELHAATPELKALAALASKPDDDTDLSDFFGETITVGSLAQNALDGMAMLKALADAHAAKELTDQEYEDRRFLVIVEFAATGDTYQQVVARRVEAAKRDAADKLLAEDAIAKPEAVVEEAFALGEKVLAAVGPTTDGATALEVLAGFEQREAKAIRELSVRAAAIADVKGLRAKLAAAHATQLDALEKRGREAIDARPELGENPRARYLVLIGVVALRDVDKPTPAGGP